MHALNTKISNAYEKLSRERIGGRPVSHALLNIAYENLMKSELSKTSNLASKTESELARLLVTGYKMAEKNEYRKKLNQASYLLWEGQILGDICNTSGMENDISSLEQAQADHYETRRAERFLSAQSIVADIQRKLEKNQQLKEYFQVAFLGGHGELSVQEIAEKMDISLRTAERIIRKFKDFLAKHHEFERSDIGLNDIPAQAPRGKGHKARFDHDINMVPECPRYYEINLEKKIRDKNGYTRYGRKVKFDIAEKLPSGKVLRINSKAYNTIPGKRPGRKSEQNRLREMAGECRYWKEVDYMETGKSQWDILKERRI